MGKLFLLPVFLSALLCASFAYDHGELRCLVCKKVAEEIQKDVSKVDSSKTVDVGGYQLDDKGNVNMKKKPLAQSEMFLSEVMDSVCERFQNYARATLKTTGRLVLVNLMDMTSKPSINEVDFIQDGDLNRSLDFLCKGIVEEFEDDVFHVFGKNSKSPVDELCVESADLCSPEDADEDYEDRDEL